MSNTFVPTKEYDLIHELGICGCGMPEETYKAVHDMLKHAFNPYEYIIQDCEYEPYMLFMAYTLDNKGFMEHGSSIYAAWLTDKGKRLLIAMDEFEKYGYDPDRIHENMPNMFYKEEKSNDVAALLEENKKEIAELFKEFREESK